MIQCKGAILVIKTTPDPASAVVDTTTTTAATATATATVTQLLLLLMLLAAGVVATATASVSATAAPILVTTIRYQGGATLTELPMADYGVLVSIWIRLAHV